MTPEERKTIIGSLTRHFGVDGRGAEELIALAESQLAETTGPTSYTQQLVEEYDQDQRLMLAEMLREVASADGWLDQHEESLLGRFEQWLRVDRASLRPRATVDTTRAADTPRVDDAGRVDPASGYAS